MTEDAAEHRGDGVCKRAAEKQMAWNSNWLFTLYSAQPPSRKTLVVCYISVINPRWPALTCDIVEKRGGWDDGSWLRFGTCVWLSSYRITWGLGKIAPATQTCHFLAGQKWWQHVFKRAIQAVLDGGWPLQRVLGNQIGNNECLDLIRVLGLQPLQQYD